VLSPDIYNIATGVATSAGRLAELSQRFSAFPVKVELGPGELMQRCEALDISRAREELGLSLNTALKKVFGNMRTG